MRSLPLLVADYADGLTQVQIAKKYGLHVQTVRKRLIQAGVDTRARLCILADEDLRAARAAMDDGASIIEIFRGLGVAHTTVTIAGASRSAGITIAHHPDPATDLSDPRSGTAITIAHHVKDTL